MAEPAHKYDGPFCDNCDQPAKHIILCGPGNPHGDTAQCCKCLGHDPTDCVADDEYACSQCHEVYAGTPPHETISNEPLCCRCLSAETGEPCDHPLFTA